MATRHNTSPSLSAQLDGAVNPPPEHQHLIPAGVQSSSYIQILATHSIRGIYTINTGLSPPASMIPANLSGKQTAYIESQKGNITIDLFVLPNSYEQDIICMTLKSQNGSARVRVHDAEPGEISYIRGPLGMMVNASKTADIYIPRSFKGPLQMVTGNSGEVCYSTAVRPKVAAVFSGNGQNKSLIGGLPVNRDGGKTSHGDQLTVNANEVINIYYDDESNIPTKDISTPYSAKLQRRLAQRARQSTRPLRGLRRRATGSLRTFWRRNGIPLRSLPLVPLLAFVVIGAVVVEAGRAISPHVPPRIKRFFTRSTVRQRRWKWNFGHY